MPHRAGHAQWGRRGHRVCALGDERRANRIQTQSRRHGPPRVGTGPCSCPFSTVSTAALGGGNHSLIIFLILKTYLFIYLFTYLSHFKYEIPEASRSAVNSPQVKHSRCVRVSRARPVTTRRDARARQGRSPGLEAASLLLTSPRIRDAHVTVRTTRARTALTGTVMSQFRTWRMKKKPFAHQQAKREYRKSIPLFIINSRQREIGSFKKNSLPFGCSYSNWINFIRLILVW